MRYIVLLIIVVYFIRLIKKFKRVFNYNNTTENSTKNTNKSISKNIVDAEFEDVN